MKHILHKVGTHALSHISLLISACVNNSLYIWLCGSKWLSSIGLLLTNLFKGIELPQSACWYLATSNKNQSRTFSTVHEGQTMTLAVWFKMVLAALSSTMSVFSRVGLIW